MSASCFWTRSASLLAGASFRYVRRHSTEPAKSLSEQGLSPARNLSGDSDVLCRALELRARAPLGGIQLAKLQIRDRVVVKRGREIVRIQVNDTIGRIRHVLPLRFL